MVTKSGIKVSAILVRIEGVEPTHLSALDPKSSVSTNSTISALVNYLQSYNYLTNSNNKTTQIIILINKLYIILYINHFILILYDYN